MKGCNCGAITATKAALAQMNAEQKAFFWRCVHSCVTCKKDKIVGSLFSQES